MPIRLRTLLAGAVVLAAACARETTPTAGLDADLAALSLDADAGAASGQASLPGLTMAPDATYQGMTPSTDQCSWVASSGRVECAPVVRNGLTITRSIAFYDAAGVPQSHRDSLTRSANTRVGVTGTTTGANGTVTVDRSSSITISGLGRDAATHTIDGEEHGTSSGTRATDKGSATLAESFSVTTTALVVPAPWSATSWPRSGTTTRQSTLTATRGSATRSTTVSETVTFNGTSTVPVVVTRDGQSRSCTRDLATRRQTCG